jgi:hypothetical protein
MIDPRGFGSRGEKPRLTDIGVYGNRQSKYSTLSIDIRDK